MLEQYLKKKKSERDILLMTHIVLGYPNFDDSLRVIEAMAEAGVDLIELQIPFSEPMADGPVILHANQQALETGATVDKCLEFTERAAACVDVPLLFMSYYNILFRRGPKTFVQDMARLGMKGAIIPDLPPEEGAELWSEMNEAGVDPIFIYSPNTTQQRLDLIATHARGFIYCAARKGVTGASTAFSEELAQYLAQCRAATNLPLAVGFGVKERQDVDYLIGKADIAVLGSETIRVIDREGLGAVGPFLRSLRE